MRDGWQYHLKKTAGLCKKKAKRFVKLRRIAGVSESGSPQPKSRAQRGINCGGD